MRIKRVGLRCDRLRPSSSGRLTFHSRGRGRFYWWATRRGGLGGGGGTMTILLCCQCDRLIAAAMIALLRHLMRWAGRMRSQPPRGT